MVGVGAVSLMTRDQVADLEKQARSLALTTTFSATDIAGAMQEMGKAGYWKHPRSCRHSRGC